MMKEAQVKDYTSVIGKTVARRGSARSLEDTEDGRSSRSSQLTARNGRESWRLKLESRERVRSSVNVTYPSLAQRRVLCKARPAGQFSGGNDN